MSKGEVIRIGRLWRIVEGESLITVYLAESAEQERARQKRGDPAPMCQYTAVRTRALTREEWENRFEIGAENGI